MRAILLAFIVLLLLPDAAPGQRVYDFAGILSGSVQSELVQMIDAAERETTAQVAVVTVASLEGETVEGYANQLFNKWGIGRQGVNNGVLLLVAPNQRRMRIEVGYGLEQLITDSTAGEIRDQHILPYFKQGNFAAGITEGTRAITNLLRAHPDAAGGKPGSSPHFLLTERQKLYVWCGICGALSLIFLWFGTSILGKKHTYSGIIFLVWIVLVGGTVWGLFSQLVSLRTIKGSLLAPTVLATVCTAVFSVIKNVMRYRRYRPHFCKGCGTELTLLDEIRDDQYLDSVQRLEEKLGSVDYDVWVCPACLATDTETYIAWFSQYKECPKCSAHAYRESSEIMESATRYSTGRRKVTGECQSCWYSDVRYEVIPVISSSSGSSSSSGFSSSGGGGFGGGSSGGGGASGSW